MKKIKLSTFGVFALTISMSMSALSDHPIIHASYSLVSASSMKNNNVFLLDFTLHNDSLSAIKVVEAKIADDFIGHTVFSIPRIDISSFDTVRIEVMTPTSPSFFESGSPISLRLTLQDAAGRTWYQPLVSEGVEQ